ncbi:hypothetical protein V6O07_08830, partial [Arthrospira platensis SPKY2]
PALRRFPMQVAADLPLYQRAPHLLVTGVAGTWQQQSSSRTWIRQPIWLEFHNGLARPARTDTVVLPEE